VPQLFSWFGFKVESIKEFEGALDKHAIDLKMYKMIKNKIK